MTVRERRRSNRTSGRGNPSLKSAPPGEYTALLSRRPTCRGTERGAADLLSVLEEAAVEQIEVMPVARKLWQPSRVRSPAFLARFFRTIT
jgi:hypothetical protein